MILPHGEDFQFFWALSLCSLRKARLDFVCVAHTQAELSPGRSVHAILREVEAHARPEVDHY